MLLMGRDERIRTSLKMVAVLSNHGRSISLKIVDQLITFMVMRDDMREPGMFGSDNI